MHAYISVANPWIGQDDLQTPCVSLVLWCRRRFKIDDVVQASAVHFGCGMWGLIASGLLTSDSRYRDVYNFGISGDSDDGGPKKCCGCEQR